MPIGGAEDKVGRMTILREVVRLAGGPGGRIVVISTASSLGDEITHAYLQLFAALGVDDVVGIRPESRAQSAATRPGAPRWTGRTAVFMTGGNQTKLATLVVGTPLGDAIAAAHRRGARDRRNVGRAPASARRTWSRSAAAARPRSSGSARCPQGLGLLDGVIVDQHFTQRNRFGRLLALVAANPGTARRRDRRGHRGDHPAGRADWRSRAGAWSPSSTGPTCITTAYTATGTQPLMMSGRASCTPCPAARSSTCTAAVAGVRARACRTTASRRRSPTLDDVPDGTRPRTRRIAAEGAHTTTAELRRRPGLGLTARPGPAAVRTAPVPAIRR